ncbi:hypothetical protein ISS03_02120 [Patescibacteria group bacterium]|nr:hypothetical protein [Patescibacteria group bacterium]
MLSKLFGSQVRVKLLKVFLVNCEKSFSVRQLTKDLGLQLGPVKKELENLEKLSLLESYIDAVDKDRSNKKEAIGKVQKAKGLQDHKYYRVNTSFALFEEIRALIVKSHVLYKHDFVDDLKKAGDLKVLILSGLFMNNKQAPVDLLIVGEINRDKLVKVLSNYECDLGREINYTCMSEREFKYRKSMTDVFLYDVLENEHMLVINSDGLV